MNWSEPMIARNLARVMFQRKCIVMVPNCSWTGNECDLLVVTQDLRIIDVEVKLSRADLRADAHKDKWWHWLSWQEQQTSDLKRRPRDWPAKVWKHYYAMPAEVWKPELLAEIAPVSGVLLCKPFENDSRGGEYGFYTRIERRAKPNRDAAKITAANAIDIARLANLRMWDAFADVERIIRDSKQIRARETA